MLGSDDEFNDLSDIDEDDDEMMMKVIVYSHKQESDICI